MEPDEGQLLTAGTIVDETPPVIAVAMLRGHADHPLGIYAEAISPTVLYITRDPPHHINRLAVRVPVEDERQQAELRRENLKAALKRASASVDQYLAPFTMYDDGFDRSDRKERIKPSEMSSLTVDQGCAVRGGHPAGTTLRDRTPIVSRTFASHCRAATRIILGSPTRTAAKPLADPRRRWDDVRRCPNCARRLWAGPCCLIVFCRYCAPAAQHRRSCTANRTAIRVEPVHRLEDGRRPPRAFDPLPHPVWNICRYVVGNRYNQVMYYNAEDAHHFLRSRGVRFECFLYRRHTHSSWDHVLRLSFTIRQTSPVIDIKWEVRLANHFYKWYITWARDCRE
ncbi:unnamed protein product [Alopecurus aequalis]